MENKKDILKLIIMIMIIALILAYLMAIPKFVKIIDDLAAIWLIYMLLTHFYNEIIKKNKRIQNI